jgi:hypothetical protein
MHYHLQCLLATPYRRKVSDMRSSLNGCYTFRLQWTFCSTWIGLWFVCERTDSATYQPTDRRCTIRKAPFRKLNPCDVPRRLLSGLILQKYGTLPTKITKRNHQNQVIQHKLGNRSSLSNVKYYHPNRGRGGRSRFVLSACCDPVNFDRIIAFRQV